MQLIAAPSRELKKYSTWVLTALIAFDAAAAILELMAADHSLTLSQVAIGNIVLGALTKVAQLVQQQIPATAEQKVEIVQRAVSLPVKKGEIDPEITIDVAAPPTVTGDQK